MRILAAIFFLVSTELVAQQAEPLLFKEKTHDFGEVVEDSGNAETEFWFTNNSGRAMKIVAVQASCGCTTPAWSKDPVQPGATGFIKASFDPKGRVGYFNKSLTVTTDLEGGPVMLQIKGQVLAKNQPVATLDYPIEKGSLHFKNSAFNLDKIFINLAPTAKTFMVYNAGAKVIHFTEKVSGPAYIKAEVPKEIAPQQKAMVKITYDAKMKNQYGFVSDNIEIITDDEVQPIKSFSVYATIEEFFPALAPAELTKAPALRMDLATIDLGRIVMGNVVEREVGVRNTGQKELIIRALQENCTCLKVSVESMKLKPGEVTKIKFSFSSDGRNGTQQKAITIYSNDPKNPVQRLTITAYIGN